MKREISSEEAAQLHQFCIRHCVAYYDVRLELVDHLASSIEALWENNPSLPFGQALDQVYRRYGATGFRKLMSEKEQSVEKIFHKGLMKAFASMFAWPDILIAGVLSFLCIFFGRFYDDGQSTVPPLFIFCFCTFSVLFDISVSVLLYRKRKQLKERLLITNRYSGFFLIFPFEYAMCTRMTIFFFEPEQMMSDAFPRVIFLLYSGVCIVCILMSLAKYRFSESMFAKARKVYPLAFR